ncbi:MAG: hypothetical protein ACRCZ9_12215 [Fusobacteriaceae bacterium]
MRFYYPSNAINTSQSYDPKHNKQLNFVVADINHCFGIMIHNFKELVIEQLKPQIPKFNFVYIKSRLPLNEYNMRMSKYLLIKPRPLLALAVSIDSSYDGGFLKSDAFKADLSKVLDVRNFTSPLIITDKDKDNPKGNTMLSMSVKRFRVNIETTIAMGSRGQVLNAWNYWNAVSVPEFIERKEMVIEFPLPRSIVTAYAKAHELLEEDGSWDMGVVYRDLKKHSVMPIDYKMNTSTGLDEIFIKYLTPVDYKVVESTFNEGELDGHMYRNFMLMRRYELEITMPNHLFFSPFIYRFIEKTTQGSEVVSEEDSGNLILPASSIFSDKYSIKLKPIVVENIRGEIELNHCGEQNMVLYKSANYKFTDTTTPAPCKQLLDDDVLVFYNEKMKNGTMTEEDIYITANIGANNSHISDNHTSVDHVNMSVLCTKIEPGMNEYIICIYINADRYNSWLDKKYIDNIEAIKYISIDDMHLIEKK